MSLRGRMIRQWTYSKENEEEEVAVIGETADNVESRIAEADATEREVDDIEQAIDDGERDAKVLRETADALEETEQEGGASPVAARLAEVATEGIFLAYGFKTRPIASLEAFNSKASRIQATRISVEAMRDAANKLNVAVEGLWDTFKETVAKWWSKVISSAEMTLKRANKLRAAFEEAAEPGQGEVSGGFTKTLSTAQGFSKEGVMQSVKALSESGTYFKKAYSGLNDFYSKVQSETDPVKLANLVDDMLAKSFTKLEADKIKPVKHFFGLITSKNYSYYRISPGTFGNKVIAVVADNKTGEADEDHVNEGFYAVKVSTVTLTDDKPVKGPVPALSKKEAISVTDAVIKGLEAVIDQQKEQKQMVEKSANIFRAARAVGKDKTDPYAKDLYKLDTQLTNGISKLASLAVSVAHAALDYAQKSMSVAAAAAPAAEA